MKINIDTKKGKEAFLKVLQKTSDAGKKAVADIQQGAKELSAKTKNDSYLRRMKKYNPLFPDTYRSETFNIPNMIMIRDDAERRGVDVCEGAIGWLDNANGIEVMCLYDEAVDFSGINFVPVASCDAFYYVDNYDRNRFIRTDCIFSKAHEERLAELQNIANLLGAKKCSIEISETVVESKREQKSASITQSAKIKSIEAKGNEGREEFNMNECVNQRSGRVIAEFDGSNNPVRPTLKWFAQDDNVKRLIDMRCSGNNAIKSQTLELSGSTSATMSQKAAYNIDVAMSKLAGLKGKSEMEAKATKEHHSKLIFTIEF